MANDTITQYDSLTNPASGDLLEIVNIADTSMAPTGTNKKITTLNLLKRYDVTMYGAKGDGVTDDTTAIQLALDTVYNAGGGLLVGPPGTYNVDPNTTLIIGTNTHFIGFGNATVIKQTASSSSHKQVFTNKNPATGDSNIYIGHMKIVKNLPSDFLNGVTPSAISLYGVSESTIDYVHFSGGGIGFEANTTYQNTATCLTNGNNKFNKIIFCHSDNTCFSGMGFNQGSFCTAAFNTGFSYDTGISCLGAWRGNLFIGNKIYSMTNVGMGFEALANSACEAWDDLQVVDNYFDINNGTTDGIHVYGPSTGKIANGVIITGNHVKDPARFGINIEENIQDIICNENHVKNLGAASMTVGINVNSDIQNFDRFQLKNNIIRNPNQIGIKLRAGTSATSAILNGSISGNKIFDDRGGSAVMYYCLQLASDFGGNSFQNLKIYDNEFSGATISPYNVIGPASLTNVKLRNNEGYNPVGTISVNVPSTTVATTALNVDSTFYITAGATSCAVVVSGVSSITIPANACVAVFVPAGQTVTPTYTNAPTWVVAGN